MLIIIEILIAIYKIFILPRQIHHMEEITTNLLINLKVILILNLIKICILNQKQVVECLRIFINSSSNNSNNLVI